ncbi:MAG: hypothetical protein JWM11_6986 [Planctomycetaceae bacterium]|nr:hypothetical protein [Planctomycetaceae bacterium]
MNCFGTKIIDWSNKTGKLWDRIKPRMRGFHGTENAAGNPSLTLKYTYDVAGRVTSIPKVTNDVQSATHLSYDDLALTTTETDPTGLITVTKTDELGRTVRQDLPDGTFFTMVFPSGNQTLVFDAAIHETQQLDDAKTISGARTRHV